MNLSLDPEMQRLIDERVKSGRYTSPEEVVAAALVSLDQQERFGDFAPDELNHLLAEGEKSVALDGTYDGGNAFRQRQQRRF